MAAKDIFMNGVRWASDLHSASDILSAFIGQDVSEKAPAVLKGIAGIFGTLDERNLLVLREKIESAEERAILDGFFRWLHFDAFPDAPWFSLFWCRSALRVFIIKMKTAGSKYGSTTTTEYHGRKNQDGYKTVKTTVDLFPDGNSDAIDFLREIITIIKTEEEADKNKRFRPVTRRKRGYKKVLEFFEAYNVPGAPNMRFWKWVRGLQSKVEEHGITVSGVTGNVTATAQSTVAGFASSVHTQAAAIRARRQNQKPLAKLFHRLTSFT